ncbi:MAG: metallophosphoesterase [Bacilli bacterium]|nr:metallophosphoesterase [Bacilli bacterium]
MMTDINRELLNLIKEELSTDIICTRLGITKKELKNRIQSIKNEGFNITNSYNYSGTRNYVFNKENLESEQIVTINNDINRKNFRALAVADTHIGHVKYNMGYPELMYDYCIKHNINIVFHCGDLLQGDKQCILTPQEQLEELIENYPKVDGILTFLGFGNHEEAFLREYGINLKSVIEKYRDDIIPLGYGEQIIGIHTKDDIVICHASHNFESNGVRLSGHSHRYKFVADDYNPTVTVPTLSDFLHTNDYPGAIELLLESENEKVRKLALNHLIINENNEIKQVSRTEHKSLKTRCRK